jgi:hypothetical protein
MTDLRVVTTEGADAILEEAAVHDFAANLRGPLLRPGDGGYDEARKVWNGMIDRHPALIARCAGVADVIAAVRFAARTSCSCRSAAAVTTSAVMPSAKAD